MTSLNVISRKMRSLEDILLPKEKKPTGPDIDFLLFTHREKEIGDTIHLFHDIAVRLGHGELRACRYHIPIEYDPNFCLHAREEALMNASPEELERIGLEAEIYDKWIRLTALLTETEKDAVKEYNELIGSHNPTEEIRLYYEQIMAKYDAKSYEDSDMKPYLVGSGIPRDVFRKMDAAMATVLEAKEKSREGIG